MKARIPQPKMWVTAAVRPAIPGRLVPRTVKDTRSSGPHDGVEPVGGRGSRTKTAVIAAQSDEGMASEALWSGAASRSAAAAPVCFAASTAVGIVPVSAPCATASRYAVHSSR